MTVNGIPAMVVLASENGRSILVMFEGILRTRSGGGLAGMAPLSSCENGHWIEIVEGTTVELVVAPRAES